MSPEELDKKIAQIQKSTRTTFRIFAPAHEKFRMKYSWYYNWHTNPHATKFHIGTLLIYTFAFFAFIYGSLLTNPQQSQASLEVNSNNSYQEKDYSQTFKAIPKGAAEIISERTAYQKAFQNPDGSKQYIISGSPLHYKNGSAWEDIDSNIQPIPGTRDFVMSEPR
jgi:hypothetical protein